MNLRNLKSDYCFHIPFNMNTLLKKHIVFGVLFTLTSCSQQLYIPKNAISGINILDLQNGRNLYVTNCASCHQLFLPKQFSKEDWIKNLNSMQIRSNISDVQKKLIYQYLTNAP